MNELGHYVTVCSTDNTEDLAFDSSQDFFDIKLDITLEGLSSDGFLIPEPATKDGNKMATSRSHEDIEMRLAAHESYKHTQIVNPQRSDYQTRPGNSGYSQSHSYPASHTDMDSSLMNRRLSQPELAKSTAQVMLATSQQMGTGQKIGTSQHQSYASQIYTSSQPSTFSQSVRSSQPVTKSQPMGSSQHIGPTQYLPMFGQNYSVNPYSFPHYPEGNFPSHHRLHTGPYRYATKFPQSPVGVTTLQSACRLPPVRENFEWLTTIPNIDHGITQVFVIFLCY